MFGDRYRGRRVLITGHTGFKGSWLALWLSALGAEVSGVSLPAATEPNHWDLLTLGIPDMHVDLRDGPEVARTVQRLQPEIVFHLAAHSLVRPSYADPLVTWSTNVMGTAHVLDACRHTTGVQAIVVVTSDKCYLNRETPVAYRESDPLGGHDPYSASKAAQEIVAASYRQSFFHPTRSPLLATARAGNVIGGGDWSLDRLVPDLVRALARGDTLEVRFPHAVRPWQHVLESLSGYLLLGQRLLEHETAFATAWNFGPAIEDTCSVETVLNRLRDHWPGLAWKHAHGAQPHEANLLQLDSDRAQAILGWRPVWTLDSALMAVADWYRAWLGRGEVISRVQLDQYAASAAHAGLSWAQ